MESEPSEGDVLFYNLCDLNSPFGQWIIIIIIIKWIVYVMEKCVINANLCHTVLCHQIVQ